MHICGRKDVKFTDVVGTHVSLLLLLIERGLRIVSRGDGRRVGKVSELDDATCTNHAHKGIDGNPRGTSCAKVQDTSCLGTEGSAEEVLESET